MKSKLLKHQCVRLFCNILKAIFIIINFNWLTSVLPLKQYALRSPCWVRVCTRERSLCPRSLVGHQCQGNLMITHFVALSKIRTWLLLFKNHLINSRRSTEKTLVLVWWISLDINQSLKRFWSVHRNKF